MNEKSGHEEERNEMENQSIENVKLDVFLRTLIQRCMGKALDYGRISGMSDRSLTQFERSIKDDFYLIIDDGIKMLKEFGYISDEDSK
jgi:hypothetical protein